MNALHHRFAIEAGNGITNAMHLATVLFEAPFNKRPHVTAIATGEEEDTYNVNINVSSVTKSGCVIHSSVANVSISWKAIGYIDV